MKMRADLRLSWTAPAGVILLAAALAGCSSGHPAGAPDGPAQSSNTARLFTIPQSQMSHVQVLTAHTAPLTRSLRLTGSVAYDSFQTTPVVTQVSGPISRLAVVPGEHVRQGQPLLYVASPDFSQLLSNYLKAKDAYALAQKTYLRDKDLYEHHALAEQALEQGESAEVQAGGDLAAAESSLKVMGIADPDALLKKRTMDVPVRAPIAGEIVEQNVSAGQLLQAATTQCFVISNMNTVWVLVNIYQDDLPFIRVGDRVSIHTDAYPDVFHGRISYIAASLDPTTRTLQARIETANPGGKLRKDMYVTATVSAGTERDAIAVPDSAVLRDDDNQPFVYVERSGGQFGRRQVTLGESLNGQTQIVSGLSPGDRYIANGSLFLQFANSLQQ